jgi:hypothetical protein
VSLPVLRDHCGRQITSLGVGSPIGGTAFAIATSSHTVYGLLFGDGFLAVKSVIWSSADRGYCTPEEKAELLRLSREFGMM